MPLFQSNNKLRVLFFHNFSINKMKKAWIFLGVLITLSVSLSPQTATFTTASSGNNQPTRYEIGPINEATTLTFKFTFPNPTLGPTDPTTFTPQLIGDFSYNSWGVQNVPTQPFFVTLSVAVPVAASLQLQVDTSAILSVQVVLITVTKQNENDPFLAFADYLRDLYGNYFFLSTASDIAITCPTCSGLQVFKLNRDGISDLTEVAPTETNVQPGFYRIQYHTNTDGPHTAAFQTAVYLCPYPSGYTDVHNVFKGCVHSLLNAHTSNALAAHGCNSRQYYFNNTCFDADPNCNIFDTFSGYCYICFDPNIRPEEGVCQASSEVVVTCSDGTELLGTICVPLGCSGVDSSGNCSGCTQITKEVVNNACVTKSCPSGEVLDLATGTCETQCGDRQQKFDGMCYFLPANCRIMSRFLTCILCFAGYHFEGGQCVLPGGANNLRRI